MATACREPTGGGNDAPFAIETAFSFPSLAPNDFIVAFDFDAEGALWVATFEGAIIRVRNSQRTEFQAPSVLGFTPIPGIAQIEDLFIDAAGRPWVTGGRSIAVFDNGAWSVQGPPDTFGLAPRTDAIAVNQIGDILLSVGNVDAGGLLWRHNGQWTSITPKNSILPSPIVRDIEVGPDGSFWVASAMFQGRGGLIRIANGNVTVVANEQTGLLYNWIDDIDIGGGRVWLGFDVMLYDEPGYPDGGMQDLPISGGTLTTRFPFESELSSNRVRSLAWSSAGELWFTTSLDHDSVCQTCVSSIGMLDASGRFHMVSNLNYDIAVNEFLPTIREGPDGAIYIARADIDEIVRVVR